MYWPCDPRMWISPLGAAAAPATLLAMMLLRLVELGLFSMAEADRVVELPVERGTSTTRRRPIRITISGAWSGSKILALGTF